MSGDFLETSRPVLAWVLRTTWEASLIAALVLLAQWLLRGRVSARWRYNLWLLVVARLLLPTVPGSRASPFNLVQLPAAAVEQRAPTPLPSRAAPPRAVPVPAPFPGRRITEGLQLVSEPRRLVEPRLSGDATAPGVRDWVAGAQLASPPRSTFAPTTPSPLNVIAGVVDSAPAPVDPTPRDEVVVAAQPVSTWRIEPPGAFATPQRSWGTPIPAQAPTPAPWFARVNWLAVLAVGWVAGAAFVASRLAWVSLRLALAVRKLPPVTDPALLSLMHDCARELRMTRTPRLLRAPDTFGPALVGLLRPRVLLPECVIGTARVGGMDRPEFHRHEVRLILMHELAHMKRWDVAANWLLAALGALHWFNPVLWLTFRRMRADRELACDEMVLSATESGAGGAYGPTILKLLQTLSRGGRPVPGVGMVGVLEGISEGLLTRFTNPKSSIRRRIAMIARFDRQQAKHRGASVLGITLSVLATGVALTGAVKGQQAAKEPPELAAATEAENPADAPAAEDAANEARAAANEALDAARQQADAARQQLAEAQQSASERRQALQEAAKEAEQGIAEARQAAAEQEAQARQAIDEARRALEEAKQSAAQRRQEVAQALQQAKREVAEARDRAKAEATKAEETDADTDDNEAGRERIAEQEEAVREAVAEGEEAVREAQRQVEEAVAQRDQAVQEAHAAIEQAAAERQEALQGAAEAAQEVAAAQQSAREDLLAAQQALQAAQQAFEGAAPAPGAADPATPPGVAGESADAPPQPEAPQTTPPPAPDAPPAPEPAPAPALPPGESGPAAPVGPIALPTPAGSATPAAADPFSALPPPTPAIAASPTAPRPVRALAAPVAPASADAARLPDEALPAATPVPTSVEPVAPGSALPAPEGAAPVATSVAPAAPTPAAVPPGGMRTGGAGYSGMARGMMPGMMSGPAAAPSATPAAGGVAGRAGPGPGYRPVAAQSMPGMMRPMGGVGMSGAPGTAGMGMYPGMPMMAPGGAPAAGGQVEDPSSRAADARTTARLQKAVPIELNGVGLSDALDQIADKAGVDVVTDWKALETAGVNRDAQVSLRLRQGVPAEQLLTWVLRTAAGDLADFAIDHGVVVVSTKDQLDRMVLTRAYDVRSIHASPGDMEELVRETVSPNSWRQNGGTGSARVFQGQLFVTATEPNHRQVDRLLGLMKAQGLDGGDGKKGQANQPPGAPGGYPGYPGGAIPGGGYPGMRPGGGYGGFGGYPGGGYPGGGYGAPAAPKNDPPPAK